MRQNSLSRRTRLFSAALILSLGITAIPLRAGAQDASAENIAAARSLGIQGVKLAEEGRCVEAIEKLERAEALYHAPTILGRLGECQVQVGKIVKGTENLNRVVREQLAANAPRAFVDAQERARKVLQQALPRIAYLTVNIEPPGTAADVTVGGTPMPRALIGAERPTDPGSHELVARAQGYAPAKATVTLKEGAHESVTLKLSADPTATVDAPPPKQTPETTTQTPSGEPASADQPPPPKSEVSTESGGSGKTIGWVLVGLGGVGLGVGSVTGLMAMGKTATLEEDCSDQDPTNCSQDDIDSANGLATISTVGFGVGAGALLVGVIVLAASGSSNETAAQRHQPRVRPYVGLGNAGVTGSF